MTTVVNVLSIVSRIALALVVLGTVLYITSPKGRARRKNGESFLMIYLDIGVIFMVIAIIAAVTVSMVYSSRVEEEDAMNITAANTPVHLFLELSPDLTVEEVDAMTEEYGWYNFSVEVNYASGKKQIEMTIYPEEEILSSLSANGAYIELTFTTDDSPTLLSAKLVIKTDDGSATCCYYPTEYTDSGGETGFNLTVKAKGKLFSEKYLLDTAQEVIDIVYPIVYPDGLA